MEKYLLTIPSHFQIGIDYYNLVGLYYIWLQKKIEFKKFLKFFFFTFLTSQVFKEENLNKFGNRRPSRKSLSPFGTNTAQQDLLINNK